jgi:hypothetical protein
MVAGTCGLGSQCAVAAYLIGALLYVPFITLILYRWIFFGYIALFAWTVTFAGTLIRIGRTLANR